MIRWWLIVAVGLLVVPLIILRLPQARAAADDPLNKIAPWVLTQTAAGAQAEFLIVLKPQASLSGTDGLPTKAAKGRYVYDALRSMAQSTQGPIERWLSARGIEHRAFYIVNAIWVKADQAAAIELANRSDVARLEANPVMRAVPDLPIGASGPDRSERRSAIEPGLAYVHAPEVWALGYTGQGVVIGGQDTGIQWDHPALKDHYRGWNGVTAGHDFNWHDAITVTTHGSSCGVNSPTPCDDNGHGTHTIGTAVGSDGGANQIGMAPGAKWIGCRNMDRGFGSPATYLDCFQFFLAPYPVGGDPLTQGDPDLAPDVTTNSWSCPDYEGCLDANVLRSAVQAQRAAGIMTVVSAGNDGYLGCSSMQEPPSFYADVYTVGALQTGTDALAGFSNRGPITIDASQRRKPDLVAPGTGTRSSLPGNTYGSLSGTSMAAPHVAGAVALLWSARPDLRGQVTATEQLLNESAVHLNSTACGSTGWPNNTFGYGRLDVLAAMYGVEVAPQTSALSSDVNSTVTYTVRVTNTAVTTDTIDLALTPGAWLAHLALTTTGALPPGAGFDVTVTVNVPDDAWAFTPNLTTFTASSQAVPTRQATSELTTIANRFDGVAMTPAVSSRAGLPGMLLAHPLRITNTGNLTNVFGFSTSGHLWLAAVVPPQVTLSPYAALTVTAYVLIPASASDGGDQDVMHIVATGVNATTAVDVVSIAQWQRRYLPLMLR